MTHTPMFHQVEGLAVDETITFGDLKGVLEYFARAFFEADLGVRFRPSYFPFTERRRRWTSPVCSARGTAAGSASRPGGSRCSAAGWCTRRCTATSASTVSATPDMPSGWGWSVLAMLRYGVDDLRLFFDNDLALLRQFA